LAYSGVVSLRERGQLLWAMTRMLWIIFAPILAAAVFGVWMAWTRGRPAVRVCVWWWLASFLTVSVGGYYREHYFILLMPAVALLAAFGVEVLAPMLEPKRRAWHGRVAAGLAIIIVAWPLILHLGYYVNRSPTMICRFLYGVNPFPESLLIANELRANSEPDDKIFVCGSEPQILFYAERASASRYIFVYPLFAAGPDAQARQRSVVEELRRQRPKFIVTVDPLLIWKSYGAARDAPRDLTNYLEELTKSEYRPFALVTLARDGTNRIVRSHPEIPDEPIMLFQSETITIRIWERRAPGDYTEPQPKSGAAWDRGETS
jgi:hypothetical protein